VLAASAWLALIAWSANPPRSLRPDPWALLPLGALVVLLAGLELLFVNNARLLLLPLLLLATIAFVFGREATRRLAWPVLFLYFALPQWSVLNGALQSLTTAVVSRAVRWTGVPAFVDGNFVHLPSGTFEIAAGCSGLNYLQAGTALAAFYALLSLGTWRARLQLVSLAAAVAIAFNWLRVYAVIVVGHVSEMQHYLITGEHHTFGWVLFMAAMVPMFLFASRLERLERAPVVPRAHDDGNRTSVSRLVLPAAVAAAVFMQLPMAVTPATAIPPSAPANLPDALGDELRAPTTSGWSPVFLNASEDSASFSGTSPPVEVYRAVYAHQDSEHRLLRPGNDFLGLDFRLLEQRLSSVALADGTALDLTEYLGTLRQRQRVIWAWYWVAGTQTAAREFEARLADLRGLISGRRDGVAIAAAAECIPDCATARKRLDAFVRHQERALRWP
jgi:EpsI family protein